MILQVLSLPPSSAMQAILLCNQATMLNESVARGGGWGQAYIQNFVVNFY